MSQKPEQIFAKNLEERLKRYHVSFEKGEIRSKIPKISCTEARRLRGSIYDALIKELYEEGCLTSASHFQRLVDTELEYEQLGIIREKVSGDHNLLLALFENIKEAEKSAKLKKCGSLTTTFRLLLQCVELLKPYKWKLDWLLNDAYKIITEHCEKALPQEDSTFEIIARIYYKYGRYLSEKGEEKQNTCKYLEMAIELARGQIWPADQEENCRRHLGTLHEAIAKTYFAVLIQQSKLLLRTNVDAAIELTIKANMIIAEIGKENNLLLFCCARMQQVTYLIEKDQHEQALQVLASIQEDISVIGIFDFMELQSQLFLSEGKCYIKLHNLIKAQIKLKQALMLSRKYDFRQLEADTLLTLGRLYSNNIDEIHLAREAFENAKQIFIYFGDMESKKQVDYLLAKLKADKIFPTFLDLLKSKPASCGYYNLRQWKNHCKPFWKTMHGDQVKEEQEPIYCLLEEAS